MRESDTDQETMARPVVKTDNRPSSRWVEKSPSRANQVRARKTPHQSTTTRPIVSQASSRSATGQKPKTARYVVPSRPVSIRGTISPLPIQKPLTSKTHRRYNVALSTPGAEIRLPSITLGRPGWRVISGIIVICMLFAVYALNDLPQFQLSTATVTGASRVTTDDINSVLKIDGKPAFLAKPQEMVAALQTAFPEFSTVSVKVGLPASLSVNVVERQPVLAWTLGDSTIWVDQEGYAFQPRGDAGATLVQVQAVGNPPALVDPTAEATTGAASQTTSTGGAAASTTAATVVPGKKFLDPSLVTAILELGAQAPQGTPVVYDPAYGLGWNDPAGWMVYYGSDLSDMNEKLAVYKAIVQQLTQQGTTPVMISVEFPHAPFYRLEK